MNSFRSSRTSPIALALMSLMALAGLATNSHAYIAVEGGGGGYGDGIVKVQDVTSADGSYCDAICTTTSSCTTACTVRDQTCSGGTYATPTSSNYSADNNGTDTYGTTYKNYGSSTLINEVGEKDTQNDSLVCTSTGAETFTARTCGYVGVCAPAVSNAYVATKADPFTLACDQQVYSTNAVKAGGQEKKNKWFGFDRNDESGTKSDKVKYTLKQKFAFAALLWNFRAEIFSMDAQSAKDFTTTAPGSPDNWTKIYQLGSVVSSATPVTKTWVAAAGPSKQTMDEFAQVDNKEFLSDKKSKTWNTPLVRVMVGPVMVRLDIFAKAGFDFPIVFKLLKDTAGFYVGAYMRATLKGYIHAGAKLTASVIIASIGIKGTVNLITAALSGNIGLYGMHPTTGKFSASHIRMYTGADFDLTTLDGKVELIIRLLFKRWKIKLASWTGLHWNWILGGQYLAKCKALTGVEPSTALTSADYITDNNTASGCARASCESLGKTCGTWSDSCGGTLTCGSACATGGGGGGGGGGSGSMYY